MANVNGKTKRIYLVKDIPTETADKIIDGVGASVDKYVSDNKEIVMFASSGNPPNISDLESLAYHAETKEYELELSYQDGWRGYNIRCKLENGRVVIISVLPSVV